MATRKDQTFTGAIIGSSYGPEKGVKMGLAEGRKTLGEIKHYLKSKRIDITPNGLIKLLKRLEKYGIIVKHRYDDDYPVYFLTRNSLDMEYKASTFEHHAVTTSLNSIVFPEEKKEQPAYLNKIINIVGLFAFAAFLYGGMFKEKGLAYEENYELWILNVGISEDVIIVLHQIMMNFWTKSELEKTEPIESKSRSMQLRWREEQNEIHRQVCKKVRNMVDKIYPKEMKVFDKIYGQLDKQVEEYYEKVKRTTRKRSEKFI